MILSQECQKYAQISISFMSGEAIAVSRASPLSGHVAGPKRPGPDLQIHKGGPEIVEQKRFVLDHIREIDEMLDFVYGSPDHSNKEDPLDELVFILLSRRTRGSGYERVYDDLKASYHDWKDLAAAPDEELLGIVGSAGLGRKRVIELKTNLQTVHDRFGQYSLGELYEWPNGRVFEFLTSLRGVGPKSARCIMMYSLGREVFPVDTHVNRICQRLGIIPVGLHHKKAQEALSEMFPRKLRFSLHVNMLSHGREVCRPRRPGCAECVISGFCSWNRKAVPEHGRPGFMDLFAGSGGLSLGFERARFDLVAAVESDPHASATYLYNRPRLPAEAVINKGIEDVDPRRFGRRGIKVIVAGPPCQEFSRVRKNRLGEEGRKELYREVLRFVSAIRPLFVVMENVPGMASHLNREYVDKVEGGLRKRGYEVHWETINAKHYGIPQNRLRLFFIARRVFGNSRKAARRSLERVWNRIHSGKTDVLVSFLQGVSGLPRLKAGEGRDIMSNTRRGRSSDYARSVGSNDGVVFNHLARKHNPRDLEAYGLMEDGDNALVLHAKRPDLMPYSTRNFPTKFFKIRRDAPSPTIVAHLRRDANSFIHPLDSRGITPREAARLQSFPDCYRFLGSFGVQFEQIGNAVPPLLAQVIAEAIGREMEGNRVDSKDLRGGDS